MSMNPATQAPSDADAATRPRKEVLSFKLGAEEYCLDILSVQEIRGYDTVTAIANTPAFIKGVINLRGHIVPIVDLRIKFRLSEARYDATTIVIILHIRGKMIGIVVDSVSDVIAVPQAEIREAPRFGSAINTEFISGMATVDGRMLILVDIERLLSSDDLQLLDQAAS
jgi:purine-binding chemotaxis protein CheW